MDNACVELIVVVLLTVILTTIITKSSLDRRWEREAIAEGHGIYVISGDTTEFQWATVKDE